MALNSIKDGKKFRDHIRNRVIDCDLIIAGIDQIYGFVWDGEDNFTKEGKKVFADILNAPCQVLQNGNIEIFCDNEELGELFSAACAGYIACSEYDRWFKHD